MNANTKHTMNSHARLSGPVMACLCTDYRHNFAHPYGIILSATGLRELDTPYVPDFDEADYPTGHGE